MGIIFELYVECLEKTDAEQIAIHFSGLKFDLLTGTIATWKTDQDLGLKNTFGVVVYSHDLSAGGVRNLQDALEMTESGLRLYYHLRNGPNFDFAQVGIEAEQIPMENISHHVRPLGLPTGGVWLELQCILRDNIYEKLGRPKNFVREFRPGYKWNKYKGEYYKPLFSPDQKELNELSSRLFPEYIESLGWENI